MLQPIFYFIALINSYIFTQMSHPLAMGMMLLIQTTLICFMSGLMTKSFWFSYILFLIFLGGMLVLFIYITSLASNEMFSLSIKMMLIAFISMSILTVMMLLTDSTLMSSIFSNNEMNPLTMMNSYTQENNLTLNKLYNYPTNLLTMILMNYLLITLIVVVKITNMFYGPLRMMN